MTIKSNRIEIISNVLRVGEKYQSQVQLRYIHGNIIQKVVEVKGPLLETEDEATSNKKAIIKEVKGTLVRVKQETPKSSFFKYAFE